MDGLRHIGPCFIHWIGWSTPSGWTGTRRGVFGSTRIPATRWATATAHPSIAMDAIANSA